MVEKKADGSKVAVDSHFKKLIQPTSEGGGQWRTVF